MRGIEWSDKTKFTRNKRHYIKSLVRKFGRLFVFVHMLFAIWQFIECIDISYRYASKLMVWSLHANLRMIPCTMWMLQSKHSAMLYTIHSFSILTHIYGWQLMTSNHLLYILRKWHNWNSDNRYVGNELRCVKNIIRSVTRKMFPFVGIIVKILKTIFDIVS